LQGLEIVQVKHMDEVLAQAILCDTPEQLFCGRDADVPPLAASLLKAEFQDQTRH
jgi:ATP-dependent Lon protease